MSEKTIENTAEKKKMPVILFANQKGGVAKTTTATTVFNELNRRGYKCLFIDGDPQCNSTSTLHGKTGKGITTLYDVIFDDDTEIHEAIQHAEYGDIIASDKLLGNADAEFSTSTGTPKLFSLRNKLTTLQAEYDAVIMDSNPSIDHLLNALMFAATDIIVPMCAEQYSLDGFESLYEAINKTGKMLNPDLRIAGIVITRFEKRRKKISLAAKMFIESIAKNYNLELFGPIYENVKVQEAQTRRKPLMEHNDSNSAAESYREMVDKLIKEVF